MLDRGGRAPAKGLHFAFFLCAYSLSFGLYLGLHFLRCAIDPDICAKRQVVLCSLTMDESRISTPVSGTGTVYFLLWRYLQFSWVSSRNAGAGARARLLEILSWYQLAALFVYLQIPTAHGYYDVHNVAVQTGFAVCGAWCCLAFFWRSRREDANLVAIRVVLSVALCNALLALLDVYVAFATYSHARLSFQTASIVLLYVTGVLVAFRLKAHLRVGHALV